MLAIDTPGGLVSSMTAMVNQILTSPVPIVVWVYPYGARAASAGAFIVQAAHVAAMAPGTRIGAAHPVTAGGGDVPSDEMNRKITNDLAAQMRSLAEERGRSAEVAARMVTESLSLTAQEAMSRGVVDVMATELEELLVAINGRKVVVGGRKIVLDLSDYEVEHTEMPMRLKVLHFISRPDIAYLLLMLGIYAIIFEILSPGGFVLGTSGAIMILLGAYGLRMLPLNWAGIILLIAGITVMIIDLLIGGMGVLSAFGGVAIIVGGLIIYRAPGGELLRYSMTFVTGCCGCNGLCWPGLSRIFEDEKASGGGVVENLLLWFKRVTRMEWCSVMGNIGRREAQMENPWEREKGLRWFRSRGWSCW